MLVKLYNVAIRAKKQKVATQQELDSERKLRKREKIRYRKLERRFRQIKAEKNNLTEVLKASKIENKQLQIELEDTKVTHNLTTKERAQVFFGGYEAKLRELAVNDETKNVYFEELMEKLVRSRLEIIHLQGIIESHQNAAIKEESISQLTANDDETSVNDDNKEAILAVPVEPKAMSQRSSDEVHNGQQKLISNSGTAIEALTTNSTSRHTCVH